MKRKIKEILGSYIHFEGEEKQVYFGGLPKEEILSLLGYAPKTIIEFGSWDGGDGLKYKLDFPEADVVSVEADPDIFSQLEYLEEFDITVLQFAITDIDGEIDFYQSAVRDINSGEINLRSQKKAPVGSQLISTQTIKNHNNHLVYESSIIRVPAIRIDTLAKEVLAINTIDYMHVDTQGTFLYVVRGMGELRPKLIFAEVGMDKRYIGGDKIEETDQFMHELGYRKIRSSDLDVIYKLENDRCSKI